VDARDARTGLGGLAVAEPSRLVFEGVTKRFGDVVAVDDLNLEVEPGESLVLLGPSGCGKSTALRIMAGLETPTAGVVRIGDRVVNDVDPKDRDVAMVFQSYALYPHLNVRRNIEFPLRSRHVPAAQGELDVATHVEVGVEGVALEDHGHVAVLGVDVVDHPVADAHHSGGRGLEAGHDAQGGGLSAPGRTQQHQGLARLHLQVEVVDGDHVPEALGHPLEHQSAGFRYCQPTQSGPGVTCVHGSAPLPVHARLRRRSGCCSSR